MTEFRISQPGKVDMDGADIVLYHFRTFKQKENMVPESRNIVTHPWVFFDGYYFSQWSFTLIVEILLEIYLPFLVTCGLTD